MIKKIKEMKETVRENKTSRWIVYLMALLITIPNVTLVMSLTKRPTDMTYIMFAVTAAATYALYYLVDGVSLIHSLVSAASSLAGSFTGLISIFIGGSVFAFFIRTCVKCLIFGVGLIFAYVLPAAFVPLLGLISGLSNPVPVEVEADPETAVEDVDYDRVFQNVMDEIKK